MVFPYRFIRKFAKNIFEFVIPKFSTRDCCGALKVGCFAIVRWNLGEKEGSNYTWLTRRFFLSNLPAVFGELFIMVKAFIEALPVLLYITLVFSSSTSSSLPSAAVNSSAIQGNYLCGL